MISIGQKLRSRAKYFAKCLLHFIAPEELLFCTYNHYIFYFLECKDSDNRCSRWALRHNYCGDATFKPWMKENCRKSCGHCKLCPSPPPRLSSNFEKTDSSSTRGRSLQVDKAHNFPAITYQSESLKNRRPASNFYYTSSHFHPSSVNWRTGSNFPPARHFSEFSTNNKLFAVQSSTSFTKSTLPTLAVSSTFFTPTNARFSIPVQTTTAILRTTATAPLPTTTLLPSPTTSKETIVKCTRY